MVPDDAVGVMAVSNDDPLQYRDTANSHWMYTIESKTATEMVLVQGTAAGHDDPTYLGGILSNDRRGIRWINSTRPLQ